MRRLALLAIALALTGAACGGDDADSVVLLTHQSFLVSDEVLAQFTAETGVTVEVRRGADAGSVVNQAILSRDNPLGDVLFGVDNTFLSRAQEAGIFERYRPPRLAAVFPDLTAGTGDLVTPVDFGDVCLNYDRAALAELGLEPPSDLAELTRPEYAGLLVVEDPATSSPGLAFLLATVDRFGDDWPRFWAQLRDNDVLVTSGWEEAYYGHFSAASEGDRPLVVSYASSPPAEVIFAPTPLTEAPTGVVTAGCFRQVEYAGILRGTDSRAEAESLIDFMLSTEFQEDIPLNMFVFPAVTDAELPPEFVEFTEVPSEPARLDPATIAANREAWIEQWADVVLR